MNSINLSQIEKNINLLSRTDQLQLVERIIHRWRQMDLKEENSYEQQLTTMEADIEIQRELQNINKEFTITEIDGLRKP